MYTLYHKPGTCSTAVLALLYELGQDPEIVHPDDVPNYKDLHPTGAAPVLKDGERIIREGAAIVTYLLEKHNSDMLPASGEARLLSQEWLAIVNATLHPAYSKMFLVLKSSLDDENKAKMFDQAVQGVNTLWADIEKQLQSREYLSGDQAGPADFFATIYAHWNQYFPVEVQIGEKAKALLKKVSERPSYQKAFQVSQVEYKAAA